MKHLHIVVTLFGIVKPDTLVRLEHSSKQFSILVTPLPIVRPAVLVKLLHLWKQLSIAKGIAFYEPEDQALDDVFVRADRSTLVNIHNVCTLLPRQRRCVFRSPTGQEVETTLLAPAFKRLQSLL